MDLVYHGAGNRCGFGPGTHRVVPAALDRGGVSQSAENGLRAGAATTAHRVGTAGLTRFAGHGGGTTAAVTHGSTHRSRHARQPGSGAGVGGNRGPAPRWIGGPDDSRPVLARRGAPLEFGHFYLATDELWQCFGRSRAGTLVLCYSPAFSPSSRSGARCSYKSGVSSVLSAKR